MARPHKLTRQEKTRLEAQGLKPVEFWLPDLNEPAVRAAAEAEAKRMALADRCDGIGDWLEGLQRDAWENEDR